MAIERQHIEATQGEKVSGKFEELHDAEAAVERLKKAGFSEDQITVTTHGGHAEKDGTFVRGGIEVAVLADDRPMRPSASSPKSPRPLYGVLR